MTVLRNSEPGLHENLSPLDSRYRALNPQLYEAISSYISEASSIYYCGVVEGALASTLAEYRLAPSDFGVRVNGIIRELSYSEVYDEEKRIQHNIRALVNCIERHLPDSHKPYVHLFATSADIIDTARVIQYRDYTDNVLLPGLLGCLDLIFGLAEEHADTAQIGRTHGRHAEPTTFGYSMAWHGTRLESRLEGLVEAAQRLVGKLSGAVGTRAAICLAMDEPAAFESAVLSKLNVSPGRNSISTQIVQPEPLVDYLHAVTSTFGVLANVADDYRHLMRSEIGEIEEALVKCRVGSSTMPHKINPKDFENVKSFWKTYCPRMVTCYMDQISEHQRDLTNSASQRFATEMLAGLAFALDRLQTAIRGTVVNREAMIANLRGSLSDISAEPLYIGLALNGVPKGHEIVRQLSALSREKSLSLLQLAEQDPLIGRYVDSLSESVRSILSDPRSYVGDAPRIAREVALRWRSRRQVWAKRASIPGDL